MFTVLDHNIGPDQQIDDTMIRSALVSSRKAPVGRYDWFKRPATEYQSFVGALLAWCSYSRPVFGSRLDRHRKSNGAGR